MSVRAITFDFWGTLFVDQNDDLRHAARVGAFAVASGHDPEVVSTALLAAHQEFFRVHIEEQRTLLPMDAVEMLCAALECSLSAEVKKELAEVFGTTILQHPPALIDHALEAVRAAAARFPVALISDTGISPGASLGRLLDDRGFSELLAVRTFSDEVGVSKPCAPMFLQTARKLEVEPFELLHIGDLEPTDIAGVQALGGTGALFAAVNRRYVTGTRAKYVFHGWREFIALLDTF